MHLSSWPPGTRALTGTLSGHSGGVGQQIHWRPPELRAETHRGLGKYKMVGKMGGACNI